MQRNCGILVDVATGAEIGIIKHALFCVFAGIFATRHEPGACWLAAASNLVMLTLKGMWAAPNAFS